MQLYLLHLDDALESQPDFLRVCAKSDAHHIRTMEDGGTIRLWGRQTSLDVFRAKLAQRLGGHQDEATLCFMGSGDFHHVTSLLLATALEKHSGPLTVIHFDNHPDWVTFENGMHCGSWINNALEHPKVEKIITLGVCSHDLRRPEWKGANLSWLSQGLLELYPYDHGPSRVRQDYGAGASFKQANGALHWTTIRAIGEEKFIEHLLSRITTRSVYLTVDKDVLVREDAITNWDQGSMRLPYLLSLIKEISKRHTIVGADVTGDYSTPSYSGTLWTRLRKHAEIFMDQPHGKPDPTKTATINSAANHALLEVLSGAMA